MKNITITVDLKSICIGAVGVLCIVGLSNFNKPDAQRNDTYDEIRRYQAVMSEKGTIILDTRTGKYIYETTSIGKPRWIKSDFVTTHGEGAKP